MLKFGSSFIAMIFAIVMLGSPAFAHDGTKVIVINGAQVRAESKAGLDVVTKLSNIQGQMQNELQPTAKDLENHGRAIQLLTANKTPEQVRSDPNLVSQIESFGKKREDFEATSNLRSQELQLTERKAWGNFMEALQPVIETVKAEYSADLILDRSTLIFMEPALDVTTRVIELLDEQTPAIAVTREKVPQQQEQQQGGIKLQ